jgi:hypothetical protein
MRLESSHVDDGGALCLRSACFLNELAEIVRIVGEQHDWAF